MRMRLDSIDLYHVRIPLVAPLCLDRCPVEHKDAVLMRVRSSRGVGWGEASRPLEPNPPAPDIDTLWNAACRDLAPAALALTDTEPSQIVADLAHVEAPPCLLAALDMAAWHTEALARDVPLHSLLGGFARPIASALSAGPVERIDDCLHTVEQRLASGYRALKVCIRPNWDVEPIAAVRHRWPDVTLFADADGRYTMDDLTTLRNLDKYGLDALIRPLPTDAADHYPQLRASLASPLSIDAAGLDPERLQALADAGAVDLVTVDVQRCGGLTAAARAYGAARVAGLPCHLTTTPDLGIGAAAALQFGLLDGMDYPTDIGSSAHRFADDLLEPPIVVDAGGYLHLPDGPGFGYRPSPEKVAKYALTHETVMA